MDGEPAYRRIFGFSAAVPRKDLRTRPSGDRNTCLVDMEVECKPSLGTPRIERYLSLYGAPYGASITSQSLLHGQAAGALSFAARPAAPNTRDVILTRSVTGYRHNFCSFRRLGPARFACSFYITRNLPRSSAYAHTLLSSAGWKNARRHDMLGQRLSSNS